MLYEYLLTKEAYNNYTKGLEEQKAKGIRRCAIELSAEMLENTADFADRLIYMRGLGMKPIILLDALTLAQSDEVIDSFGYYCRDYVLTNNSVEALKNEFFKEGTLAGADIIRAAKEQAEKLLESAMHAASVIRGIDSEYAPFNLYCIEKKPPEAVKPGFFARLSGKADGSLVLEALYKGLTGIEGVQTLAE